MMAAFTVNGLCATTLMAPVPLEIGASMVTAPVLLIVTALLLVVMPFTEPCPVVNDVTLRVPVLVSSKAPLVVVAAT